MKQIITHFTDNDLYSFTVMYYILQKYPRAEVEYTFFDRNKTKYPKGFAELLQEQMNNMKNVVITDEEVEFMKQKCYFLPQWFIEVFLRGYRFNPNELTISQDEEGYLSISVKGKWWSTIMWEMPILSTVSELSHILNGDIEKVDWVKEEEKVLQKALKSLTEGLMIADMGTRRRISFDMQDMVVRTFAEVQRQGVYEYNGVPCLFKGRFNGTSNVYLAMKYNLTPIGTMSHQMISFEEVVSGVFECNHKTMSNWADVYGGDLGIYLYDCFGDNVFFNNLSKKMAMLFNGLRVDSGLEEEQVEKIIDKYHMLGIDATTKQVVFSNGLNIDRAIEIHKHVNGRIKDSYGIGTHLTCDVTDCKPMNIVVKLTKCRITESREWHDCVKLSCDKGKTLGNNDKCKYLLSIIG
jgi:nicotinate phosphoribosyltransferase